MVVNNFKSLLDAWDEAKESLCDLLPNGDGEALEQRLLEKSEQNTPQIMVYGYYNAGKSTLLNALLGKEVAPMADHPETDKVTAYRWNGFTLLDTPGIDAPSEHEKVAKDELKKSDVVLFVLASGGSVEEKSIWDEIKNIYHDNRSLIILVNNKTGMVVNSEAYIRLTKKLGEQLQKATGNDNVVQDVPILLVNAKSALQAKLENKPNLLKHSQLTNVEDKLNEFLSKNQDRSKIIEVCTKDLETEIKRAQDILDNKATDTLAPQRLAIEKASDNVNEEQKRFNMCMDDEISRQHTKALKKIVSLVEEIVDNMEHGGHQSEEHFQTKQNKIAEDFAHELERRLEEEIQNTKDNLGKIAEKLSDEIPNFQKAGSSTQDFSFDGDVGIHPSKEESFSDDGLLDALKDKLPAHLLHGQKLKDVTEFAVKEGLKHGKELFPKLFKGIGEKTMEKWAGVAGKYAGPVVASGQAIYEVYNAFAENEKAKKNHELKISAINKQAEYIAKELKDFFNKQIVDTTKTIFAPIREYLSIETKKYQSDNDIICSQQQSLDRAKVILNGRVRV